MIDIIAVTYGQRESLKCFINSIKAQTDSRWRLFLIHDGPNPDLKTELEQQGYLIDDKVIFLESETRGQHYGHPNRRWALQTLNLHEYVLLTNGDNYYTPTMVAEVLSRKEDFIYFDCVHSHVIHWAHNKSSYGLLTAQLANSHIDMGCAVIRSSIAQQVGFPSDTFAADWIYFQQVLAKKPSTHKINKILFVHN